MTTVLSTEQVPQRERVAYWHDVICRTFVRLDVDTGEGPFRGRVTSSPVGLVRCSRIDANPMDVRRSGRHIAELHEDELLLAVHLAGEAIGAQDGRQADLHPGDVALFDAARPYTVQFRGRSAFHHLVVQMPRCQLQERVGGPESITAVRVPHQEPLGGLVFSFLTNFARTAASIDQSIQQRLSEHAIDLIATALGSRTGLHRVAADSLRAAHRERVYAFIDAHLGDPDLDPATIAAALHISPRYLHKLFESEPLSVSRAIWARRLERCRRNLEDRAFVGHTIAGISHKWGFRDGAHFSRAFKERYGRSPSEHRQLASTAVDSSS